MWPLNVSNTGAETVKGPKLTAEHWYLDNQLVCRSVNSLTHIGYNEAIDQ